jgi:hypothetical protein
MDSESVQHKSFLSSALEIATDISTGAINELAFHKRDLARDAAMGAIIGAGMVALGPEAAAAATVVGASAAVYKVVTSLPDLAQDALIVFNADQHSSQEQARAKLQFEALGAGGVELTAGAAGGFAGIGAAGKLGIVDVVLKPGGVADRFDLPLADELRSASPFRPEPVNIPVEFIDTPPAATDSASPVNPNGNDAGVIPTHVDPGTPIGEYLKHGTVKAEKVTAPFEWTDWQGDKLMAQAGDWKVTQPNGNINSVKPDIFEITYSPVPGQPGVFTKAPTKAQILTQHTEVMTLEDKVTGEAGDYLVTGPKGEQYILKRDEFHSLYRPVSFHIPVKRA